MSEYAVTVYSTDDTERNAELDAMCEEEDKRKWEEYNAHCASKTFNELEDAVGYDLAVELTK